MTIFGMGSGPHQKQTGQTETMQAVEHTLIALCLQAVMIIGVYAWAMLVGRIVGPLCLALWGIVGLYFPRDAKWRAAYMVMLVPWLAFSYAGIYGPWPTYTITWAYWPWVQYCLIFFLPLAEYPLVLQLERQLSESLFPNLANSVKARPGNLIAGLVPGISYPQGDKDNGPDITWSAS